MYWIHTSNFIVSEDTLNVQKTVRRRLKWSEDIQKRVRRHSKCSEDT